MNGEKTIPNYSEEAEALEGWIDMFVANLSKAAENALNKFVRSRGHAEAFLLGLARFTCRIIQNMENEGLSAKTGSVWDSYYYGLLPLSTTLN